MFRNDFNNYASVESIKSDFNLSDEQWEELSLPYYEERAKRLIEKLEELDDTLPKSIKEAIWKLQVISFTANRIANPYDLEDAVAVEEIDNYAIKVRSGDYTKYSEVSASGELSVSVVSDLKIEIPIVVAIEKAILPTLTKMAKRLKDKVLSKDLVRELKDKVRFHRECAVMGLDPRNEDENEVRLMFEVFDEADAD